MWKSVARSTAYHAKQAIEHIKKGINNKGFSLIEGISLCPTYYGRKNKKGSAVQLMNMLKDNYVDVELKDKLPAEKLENKMFYGVFKNTNMPEYTEEYEKIINKFK